ncbi:MAG TPA: hypothetical protein VFW47_18200 [Phenylobacterium sp.]|nr:hypothetical protein [Phenylobacterium sp.]
MKAQAVTQEMEASVASVLGVLAWEIELAGARCLKLDALIGELMPDMAPEQRAKLLEGLHTVDLLGQQLTSLSAFARHMSEVTPPDATAPVEAAIADMTLGALADRMLTALGGEEKGLNDGDDAGDLDLF